MATSAESGSSKSPDTKKLRGFLNDYSWDHDVMQLGFIMRRKFTSNTKIRN